MRLESIAICNALLENYAFVCPVGNENFRHCTIGYRRLCTNAGVPELYRRCGECLLEIAQRCFLAGLAPLNALAINEEEGQPGDHYDVAPGCSLLNWPAEAASTVAKWRHPMAWTKEI